MVEIIGAAERILSRGQHLTIDALSEESGLSRSTIYRKCGGKAALVKTLADRGINTTDSGASTRERILSTVREHIAREGVVTASVETVAKEAGVGPITIYRLFGDRATLIREAMAGVLPKFTFEGFEDSDESPKSVLLRVAAELILFASTFPGLVALILLPSSADRADLVRIHGFQRDLKERFIRFFELHGERGTFSSGDAAERAGAFMGLCLGASLLRRDTSTVDKEQSERRAARVIERFFKGDL